MNGEEVDVNWGLVVHRMVVLALRHEDKGTDCVRNTASAALRSSMVLFYH